MILAPTVDPPGRPVPFDYFVTFCFFCCTAVAGLREDHGSSIKLVHYAITGALVGGIFSPLTLERGGENAGFEIRMIALIFGGATLACLLGLAGKLISR